MFRIWFLHLKERKRRHRSSNAVKVKQSSFCGCKSSQIRVVSLWIAAVLITVWLMALSWLAVILYGEMGKMDTSIKSMIAGSEGLPDAIQKCDSTSKLLQKNQSNIVTQLSNFKAQLDNFTEQMAAIQRGLHEVQDSLKAEPQLASLPKDFQSLKSSVAEVGSQISDLKPTVDALKEANKNLLIAQQTMEQNVTSLKNSWLALSNVTQKPILTNETSIKIEELRANFSQLANDLSNFNQNFTTRLQWVQDDQTKNQKTLYSLKDETQNISTSVQSLRGECADIRTQLTEIQSKDLEFNKTLKQLEQHYSLQTALRTENQPAVPNSGGKKLPFSPQDPNRIQEVQGGTDKKNLGEQPTGRPKRSSLSRQ
ncbi:kinesin heavy chain isoform X4 [Belonocnema kinseyi]|uniref:kinesin heavy chain isoform X4 n=1 Tax=Belonocnema kinseyi TaxID=2817044 RepID=UPI00143D0525|nr:kinesin heavy chain isoform X4 [Belonocnema kinseyi]